MENMIMDKVIQVIFDYLLHNYSKAEIELISHELSLLMGKKIYKYDESKMNHSYEDVQKILSSINENGSNKKSKGVYYTPSDVVKFILINSIKLSFDKLSPSNIHVVDMNSIPFKKLCFEKTVYDPTCGAGEFLLAALEIKLDLLDVHDKKVTKTVLQKILATIKGNDINKDSIIITKLRLFICALHRNNSLSIRGLANIINNCFTCYDFVCTKPNNIKKYDIIVGNPPYVEDSKSGLALFEKYGNIYANVLENASMHLENNGAMGFIVPLSYIATIRMKKIREKLNISIPNQYILSYSDRPDCLFTSVHQKLCIILGRKTELDRTVYTGNYRYWYREERNNLFNTTEVIDNNFVVSDYIPKIGNKFDKSIYSKVISNQHKLFNLLQGNKSTIYLNMRAAFWIKAFKNPHKGSEYKMFNCENSDYANLVICLLNSSLFWWYWICISDCWHITNKELKTFTIPHVTQFDEVNRLAIELENKLEETKVYVGTKQTDYEYKHKECINELRRIDTYINNIYGLSNEEKVYVNNFAYRYRISGGVKNGRN